LTAKNVTSANYAADYGVTRYLITTDGSIDIVSDKKDSLERHVSGCWIIN
jgi:predicted type IV restriction endonuclease